jgi:hypothetical protein
MALDPTQEARADEINAALRKTGTGALRGPERTAVLDELAGIYGSGEQKLAPVGADNRARFNEITSKLLDDAMGKPGPFIGALERAALADELAKIPFGHEDAGGGGEG